MRRVRRVVLEFARVARLDNEVPPVTVQVCPVQHVVLFVVEVDLVPVGHEPVLVVADEQVGVASAEEAAGDAFAGAEAGPDRLDQLALTVLAAEDILVGPRVPIRDRFPPRGAGNQFRDRQAIQDCHRPSDEELLWHLALELDTAGAVSGRNFPSNTCHPRSILPPETVHFKGRAPE